MRNVRILLHTVKLAHMYTIAVGDNSKLTL